MAEFTAQRLHILGLPQELQDMIFDFAYCAPEGTQLISQDKLHESARTQYRYRGRIFQLKVSEWLISKKWFVQAAKAYIEIQETPLIPLFDKNGHLHDRYRLLTAFSLAIKSPGQCMRIPDMSEWHQFGRLRHLKLSTNKYGFYEDAFWDLEDQDPLRLFDEFRDRKEELELRIRRVKLTDEELKEIGPFQFNESFPRLATLRSVELRVIDTEFTPVEPVFDENVKRLEELIIEYLLSKGPEIRDPDPADVQRHSLYPGSEVDIKSRFTTAPPTEACAKTTADVSSFRLIGTQKVIPHKPGRLEKAYKKMKSRAPAWGIGLLRIGIAVSLYYGRLQVLVLLSYVYLYCRWDSEAFKMIRGAWKPSNWVKAWAGLDGWS